MRNSRAVCGILAAGLVSVGALAACSSSNRKAGSEQSQGASADSSADTAAACFWSSQKPGSCICVSSADARRSSSAGSKVVREQRELVAELGDAWSRLDALNLRHYAP